MAAGPAIPAPRYPAKVATVADALSRVARLPRPLVFTNGVFDVLHRGHVTYLDQARGLGASLVVAVNSDASARRMGKGDDRPINTLDDRMAVLAALAAVDLVVPFDTDTPRELIVAKVELGFEYNEITELLGKASIGATRVAVSRALIRLAEEMGIDR